LTLTAWNHTEYGTEVDKRFYPAAYSMFKQRDGVSIDETVLPENDAYYDKVTAAVASGSPPELAFIHPSYLASLASKRALTPLDDRIGRDAKLNKADFYPGTYAYYQFPIGAKTYGVPYYSGPCVTLFNRALCKEGGVQAPDEWEREGKWTWSGAADFATQMTKSVAGQQVWGWGGLTNALHWLDILIWGNGGDLWSSDFTKVYLSDAAAVDALQQYADFATKLKVIPQGADAKSLKSGKSGNLISGRIAAKYSIKGDVPEIADWSVQSGTDIGMAPIPAGVKGRFVRNGPNSYTIPTGTKHPDEAYALIAFMTTDDFQAVNMQLGGSTPPRRSQMDTLFAKSMKPWENLDMWKKAMEQDKPLPFAATHTDIQRAFGPAYNDVIAGKQTMRQAADSVVPQIQALLQRARESSG